MGHLSHLLSERVHLLLQPPLQEVNRFLEQSFCIMPYRAQLTEILTSEGTVFDQELAFCVAEIRFPTF